MNSKPKILIVDDKPENLVALRTVLKDLDIELIEATSGNDALKATLRHDFALALLDIQMPEMDGYELASILREEEKTAHLPFIFISAVYTDNLNVFKGYEKGAFSFIAKPFQPEILINKINYFIDKHLQEIALFELNKELENKNKELELINKELEAFSYTVSHDLRAPLRHIGGFVNLLVKNNSSQLDELGLRYLNIISESYCEMGNLVDALLDFSRLGRTELQRTKIDSKSLVNKVIKTFGNELAGRNVEINLSDLPDTMGDETLIYQVWVNLISNAIKYSRNQVKAIIDIGGKIVNDQVIFQIRDNGAGFDMKYADKLFGVFQRLHKASEFEGIGIGLANVNRIIMRHGGSCWAESKVEKGATFFFSLPYN